MKCKTTPFCVRRYAPPLRADVGEGNRYMKYPISIIVVAASVILTGCGSRSTRSPYSLIAGGEPPASFAMQKCSDTSLGADANIWIQFSVATQDIATVINSGGYATSESPTSFSGMHPPEWWNEHAWQKHMTYYEWKRYHPKHKDILREQRVLWINMDSGEAYFARATL